MRPKGTNPVDKIAQKAVVCRSIFDTMALYFECRIKKNALRQTVFLAIFPTGKDLIGKDSNWNSVKDKLTKKKFNYQYLKILCLSI